MKLSIFFEHILEAATQENKSLTEMLSIVKNLGFDAVDIECLRIKEVPLIKEKLVSSGLEVASVYQFFDFGNCYNEIETQDFINSAKEVGAKTVLCIPGFIHSDENKLAAMEKMCAALNRLCHYAHENGIAVTLEDFDNTSAPFSTDDGLCWFMNKIDLLRFTFDTGNFIYSEIDEIKAYDKLKNKIVHVHLKDRSLYPSDEDSITTTSGRKLYPSPIGSGCVKIDECIHRLKEQGYNGYYTIEHFNAKNQLDYMKKSIEFVRGVL